MPDSSLAPLDDNILKLLSSTTSAIGSSTRAIEKSLKEFQTVLEHRQDTESHLALDVSETSERTTGFSIDSNESQVLSAIQTSKPNEIGISQNQSEELNSTSAEAHLTSKSVVASVGTLEALINKLIHMLGEFSSAALKLLWRTLRQNIQIYALLREVQASILQNPTIAIQDCFHFTDVLGRTHVMPYQYFKHWEVFESALKCEFKRLPGEQRIIRGDYHILNASSHGSVIDRKDWETSVFPGQKIKMSIVIGEILFPAGTCPRNGCGGASPEPEPGSSLVIW